MSHPVSLPLANGGTIIVPSNRIVSVDHPVEQGAGFCYVQLQAPSDEPRVLVVALPISDVHDRMAAPWLRVAVGCYLNAMALGVVALSMQLAAYLLDLWLFL